MSSKFSTILIGLILIILGVGLAIFGWGYPVTYCVTGTGISKSCTTDPLAVLTATALAVGGIGGIVLGVRMLWKVR